LKFLALILAAAALSGAETGNEVAQTFCKPGGFAVVRFSGGTEARGKADSAFNVGLDAGNYQGNAFDTALRSAAASWSAVSGSTWRYTVSGYTSASNSSGDGLMTVQRGGLAFPQGVLATTMISALVSSGQIVDSDIYFNPASNFGTSGGTAEIDFESVAVHEMGHGLGLDHNDGCSSTRTVMQSTISAGTLNRGLSAPEQDGVRYLYPGTGGGTEVTASPSAMVFGGTAGGAALASQSIVISGAPGTAWAAAVSSSGWLSVSPASGMSPGTASVRVAITGLSAGFYSGRVTIQASGASHEVAVALSLSQPAVTALEVSPASLRFTALAGVQGQGPQTLSLSGTPGASWTAAPTTPWLAVTPTRGILPATLIVSVATVGLAAQTYTGQVTVLAGTTTRQAAVSLVVTSQPRLEIEPAQVSLTAPEGATIPACATFRVAAGNAAVDWTATAAAGASWLTVLPASGRAPATASVCATAAGVAPGAYSAGVQIASAGALNSPFTVTVNFTIASIVAVSEGGVINAASLEANRPLAAGELVTLFGRSLAPQTALAGGFPLPTELAGTRVLLGGVPARLLYVAPGQINLVTPSTLAGLAGTTTTLAVFNGKLAAPAVRVAVARQAPGVFTMLGNGAGAGAITHADGSLVTRSTPVTAGETVLVYLTGMGGLTPAVPDGAPAPADPLAAAANPVRLLVDGREAEVLFAGAAPGFAGLQVVVATLPPWLGRRFPEMAVEVGGTPSNRFSAGGPSLYDVTPFKARANSDAVVVLRGMNLAPSSVLDVSGVTIPATVSQQDWQEVWATIPARVLGAGGTLTLRVVDPQAPLEPPSNPVTLLVER